jgi:hypothetical protein
MKKKRKKIDVSPRSRERYERTMRMLQERLDFHERLREQRRAARGGEQASGGE